MLLDSLKDSAGGRSSYHPEMVEGASICFFSPLPYRGKSVQQAAENGRFLSMLPYDAECTFLPSAVPTSVASFIPRHPICSLQLLPGLSAATVASAFRLYLEFLLQRSVQAR